MAHLNSRFIGSISEGTLRTEDLLPKFILVLAAAEPEHKAVLEYKAVWDAARELSDNTDYPNAEDVLNALGYWDSDSASYLLNETVFDALNDVAPEGTSFGTSDGDGASFGFWYGDCEVCGENLYEHSPEGQACDDPDFGETADVVLAEGE